MSEKSTMRVAERMVQRATKGPVKDVLAPNELAVAFMVAGMKLINRGATILECLGPAESWTARDDGLKKLSVALNLITPTSIVGGIEARISFVVHPETNRVEKGA